MLRLAGALLLLAGSTGIAMIYCHEHNERLRYLKLMREIFAYIQNEMAYLKAAMPEICFNLSRRDIAFGEVFLAIYQESELNNGCYFNEIWARNFRERLKKAPLKDKEKDMLLFFPESLIFRDSGGQAEGVEKYIDEATDYIDETAAQIKNKNKVTMCLGIMAGLMAVIILF